ncbi:Ppx/GppA family phosphatase [Streptomyces sp. TRM66268-LWL]|uniref:Ppx/GppA family phosphatase n=1 Tax=Streptomyces polyasparticus TaxID=2767826 RepID=A0ABR7SQ82_9ACTN|nr:Ppx/GppA phosphatase family protein [Streptomyces polyasparticus]MBC9716742.1 Ppx/GppA family phosphatase [Streptomyces polyasparticus]
MTRVAAIDCGTNSIRLLVADISPETGELVDLDRRMTIVRLGQGVDRTGMLAPEALERTFAACREYAAVIKELGAEKVRFVATSASRDASNRDDFVRGVLDILGVEPEVISGDEEAQLSFAGAASAQYERGDAHPLRTLVFDVGGGSTEFVLGSESIGPATVDAARSVDIGCVRLTERHGLTGGPLTDEQTAAVRADIDKALDLAAETVPLTEADVYIGLAGTVTTLAGIALDLPEYDSTAIHRSVLSYHQVKSVTQRLITATHDERAAIPVMHPGRVDVICAGALIVLAIMERTGARELLVSEHDILDGIALSAA